MVCCVWLLVLHADLCEVCAKCLHKVSGVYAQLQSDLHTVVLGVCLCLCLHNYNTIFRAVGPI
jgi:hypothetical protein